MYWLKLLGTADHPMQDDWRNEGNRSKDFVSSRKRMKMKPGDRIVCYATGIGSVFAVGTVTSFPYKQADDEGFEWRVGVELDKAKEFLHEGVPLDYLSVDGRDLRRSIKRQSYIKLVPVEFEAAAKALA
jgi:hypothetical protein